MAGRGRLQTREQTVQRTGPTLFADLQTRPDGLVPRGQLVEAFEQGSEVESGASHDDWQTAAGRDFRNCLPGEPRIVACGVTVCRFQHVEKMVRCVSTSGDRRFGGANVEPAIQLQGVAIDDFAAESRGEFERQCGFTGPRWSGDGDESGIHLRYRSLGVGLGAWAWAVIAESDSRQIGIY